VVGGVGATAGNYFVLIRSVRLGMVPTVRTAQNGTPHPVGIPLLHHSPHYCTVQYNVMNPSRRYKSSSSTFRVWVTSNLRTNSSKQGKGSYMLVPQDSREYVVVKQKN
jgi:hypothetical protein